MLSGIPGLYQLKASRPPSLVLTIKKFLRHCHVSKSKSLADENHCPTDLEPYQYIQTIHRYQKGNFNAFSLLKSNIAWN